MTSAPRQAGQARLHPVRIVFTAAKIMNYRDTENISAQKNHPQPDEIHCFFSVMPPGIFCHLPLTANLSVLPFFFL